MENPKRQYRGDLTPTTPPTTGPLYIPIFICAPSLIPSQYGKIMVGAYEDFLANDVGGNFLDALDHVQSRVRHVLSQRGPRHVLSQREQGSRSRTNRRDRA